MTATKKASVVWWAVKALWAVFQARLKFFQHSAYNFNSSTISYVCFSIFKASPRLTPYRLKGKKGVERDRDNPRPDLVDRLVM
jgi:hypothetical protein